MKVACLMMQRDEDLLLEPWLRYHGHLFGFENIYVYDNGSVSEHVLEVLRLFESVGVNVFRGLVQPTDFEMKGKIIGDLILSFQKDSIYDVVFPLDCDEFIAVTTGLGFSLARNDIVRHLTELNVESSIAKVVHCLENRPGSLDHFRLTSFRKSIVFVRSFLGIDHGFHEAKSFSGDDERKSGVIYIHLHFKPFDLVKKHAIDKLRPFVDVDDECAVAQHTGVGRHLTRFFSMTSETYYNSLGLDESYPYPIIVFDPFLKLIQVLMQCEKLVKEWSTMPDAVIRSSKSLSDRPHLDMSNIFDTKSYLAANLDVARSDMDPVIHYCLFGFREKRSIGR